MEGCISCCQTACQVIVVGEEVASCTDTVVDNIPTASAFLDYMVGMDITAGSKVAEEEGRSSFNGKATTTFSLSIQVEVYFCLPPEQVYLRTHCSRIEDFVVLPQLQLGIALKALA